MNKNKRLQINVLKMNFNGNGDLGKFVRLENESYTDIIKFAGLPIVTGLWGVYVPSRIVTFCDLYL